ncbi:sulfate/molybdate ABC transporter ATP-binding protein [Telmatobacter bradus]|uniref:sulfate/molybdate ABC transporter ATP-binding protein n=1 Tax=Telmatobacter bradus TaxID=474953 RepID=UPI003B4392E3
MSIHVEKIAKSYGSFEALKNVSLTIEGGELVALLGPSGSGKTTLLRIIAGLETPDAGSVELHGEEATHLSAARRGIGFVFQHYALFRHMTIYENVAFGLCVQPRSLRLGRNEIKERVSELLSLVQLDSYSRMYPDQLSGGQRQRVALARALAVKPRVLLLDEPFSALDAKVRKDLRNWLRRIHDELHVTTVLVTHDQEEALEVADRVAILNRGALEQFGTPQSIYDQPSSPFVYNFLGNVNLFHGRLLADLTPSAQNSGKEDENTIGFVRPHEFEILRAQPTGSQALKARTLRIHAAGPLARIELSVAGGHNPVTVELAQSAYRELQLKEGEEVYLQPKEIRVFNDSTTGGLLEQGAGI